MNDFIFGTLATDALRHARVDAQQSGVVHLQNRQPLDAAPGQAVTVYLTAGPAQPGEKAWVYWTTDNRDPQGNLGIALCGNSQPMELVDETWNTVLWGYVRRFKAVLPGVPAGTLVRYRLSTVEGDREVFADSDSYFAYYVDDDPLPEWGRNAVIYQIFVDRFSPGTGKEWNTPETPAGFYGGTLRGITENLDYVQNLGATVLWLTPIFASPSHHGYDATDLMAIEPRLGTKQDLRLLLDAAHQRGMRVLLDFVPNHWSSQHYTFQDVVKNPDSPYRDWYLFTKYPEEYETFFGVKDLPQLNLRHPKAREAMLNAVKYWLEFGVDGYRVDYAIGPSPDFWAAFKQACYSVKPDALTFGEVVDPSDVQLTFHGGLNGCLDFMLLEAVRQTIAFGNWDVMQLARFLDRHEHFFPTDFLRPSFLDNHDMNRYLWAAGGDVQRLKLAALLQFTLAGPPVIYYGTEVGLSQVRDVRQGDRGLPEESRLPMIWDETQDQILYGFYQTLIRMRREFPEIIYGKHFTITAEKGILIREVSGVGRRLITILNLNSEEINLSLPAVPMKVLVHTDNECSLESSSTGWSVKLPGMTGLVYASEKDD